MKLRLLRIELTHERDIVAARQRARQVSSLLGFDGQDPVRIATAVSELARNALRYAGGGTIDFALETRSGQSSRLQIEIRDHGPGIEDLDQAMHNPSVIGESKLGLVTARRMMDSFDIDSVPGRGTTISLSKIVPRRAEPLSRNRIDAALRELAAHGTQDANAELQQQNRELLRSLDELRLRQEELTHLNAELEDTNRGVMALYAELDERATHLRTADEAKSRFLSSVSHELRTPVNSIMALSKILLHRMDGELNSEQERQVRYIFQAAEQLSIFIDDLLDLRKVESGNSQLRIESFSVSDLFGALRGMLKPLAVNEHVVLSFEDVTDLPPLRTDQGKVSQILRNLVSNALKFTERGSVTISARRAENGSTIVFAVVDTGIGIAAEHHRHIFEEFTQVDNSLQRTVKGTGLGLPLSQRLAAVLGGTIEIRSAAGKGSTFSLVIPTELEAITNARTSAPARVLIIDDSEIERYTLKQFLATSRCKVIEAAGGYEGLRLARQSAPDIIFLDLMMPDIHGFEVLKMLRQIEETRDTPIVVCTSQQLNEPDREAAGAASAILMKSELSRESVLDILRHASEGHHAKHA